MGRGQQSFKQKDVARLIKAALDAGLEKPVVKIDRNSGDLYVWDDVLEYEQRKRNVADSDSEDDSWSR